MPVEIIRYSLLPHDLREDIVQQDKLIFTEPIENAPEWAKPDWEVVVYEGDQWVSVLELFDRFVRVGEVILRVGGIGGVKTRPEFRRRGYAEQAMQAAAEFFCTKLGLSFGLLICAPHLVAYYRRMGWQRLDVKTTHRQREGHFVFPEHINTLIYACGEPQWPDGDIDLLGRPW